MDEALPLRDFERVARPLRRVLARGAADRAARDALFASNCGRLARRLEEVPLPDAALSDAVAELVAQFDGVESLSPEDRTERLASAWQILQRVDGVLGLPLIERDLWPRVRRKIPRRPSGGPPEPSGSEPGVDAEPLVVLPEVDWSTVEPARPAGAAPRVLTGARWDTPIHELDVPDDLVEAVTALGLESLSDLLIEAPVDVQTFSPVHGAGRELPEDERVAVSGRVRARWTTLVPDGGCRSFVRLVGAGPLDVAWHRTFSEADLLRLMPGEKVVVVGRTTADGLAEARIGIGLDGQAVVPRYGDSEDHAAMADLIGLLEPSLADLDEVLPTRSLQRHDLLRVDAALQAVHTADAQHAAASRRRLAFDEALALQLGISHSRFDTTSSRGIAHAVVHQHMADLAVRGLGDALDDEAQVAFEAIKRDLKSTSSMARLLVGPPGSDVDDVALRTALMVVESRSQVLVLAPDGPSSQVVYDRWEPVLRAFGATSLLAAGDPRRADRDALRRGEVHVVFGAPGALDLGLEWRRLGLVVAYEQADYGAVPARLKAMRGPEPDLLVVARTPVTAGVLLDAYPNLDVCTLPPPEGPTSGGMVWNEDQREEAYRSLGDALAEGKPVLIAFPMRRTGTDLLTLREADALVATLREQYFKEASIVVFHGAMASAERERAWTDFLERRASVLVATAPVELMPRSPRPIVGLVEHADRVDLQRLLGLRALCGKGGALQLVVGAEPDTQGVARARAVTAGLPDGAIVAAHPESFTAAQTAQPPVRPVFRWFDARLDADLLVGARLEAHDVLAADGAFREGAHPRLLTRVRAMWPRLMPDQPLALPDPKPPASKRRRRRRRRR